MILLILKVGSGDPSNPFVEQAVQYAVAAAHVLCKGDSERDALCKLLLQALDITILGSNDFYSYRVLIEARRLPLMSESLASLPPFSTITFNSKQADGAVDGKKCKPEVAKTGLGSSVAMTTALAGALLHYLGVVKLPASNRGKQAEMVDSEM